MRILDRLSRPLIALDVGTAMTRGCSAASGVVEMPSFVQDDSAQPHLVRGALRGGVICDVAAAADVIAPVVRSVATRWRRPAALICAPSDATPEERDLLVEAVVAAGATVTTIVPEPLAAAIGSRVDVGSEYARMIVDVGEGVTDLAVISNGQIRTSAARRTGCSDIRRMLIDWLRWHQHAVIDDAAADAVIRAFCRAGSSAARFEITARVEGGETAVLSLSRDHVGALVDPALDSIRDFVLQYFLDLPDRLAAEVIESGVLVTGGGAVLDDLVERIGSATGLSVIRPPNPLHSVITGAREMLRSGVLPTAA